tara:strand:- start:625 stop:2556 length:1932 start_codon:yes stop_codon:yes gene_type:complete
MSNIVWKPQDYHFKSSNIAKFISQINEKFLLEIDQYDQLYEWSINNPSIFWDNISKFCDINFSHQPKNILERHESFIGSKWFEGATLNFAENLLKHKDDSLAIEYFCEDKIKGKITYKELHEQVRVCYLHLKSLGVKKGDRVAGYLPNIPQTIIAMLATSALGAVWSSCSPDFGIRGVLDRFEQINPKVLFVADGYFYKGKKIDLTSNILEIQSSLSSLKETICINIVNAKKNIQVSYWDDIPKNEGKINFEQVSFSHPLYIMYSSGTTGKPKSIVHSVGGTLIQHLKELVLHCDLKKEDKIFYFTTCGWMMWNWLVSSLSVGATVVLYDGNPFYPNENSLLKLMDSIEVSIFGTSAKYISHIEQNNILPNQFNFKKLRMILSTGSPLVNENYDFVYSHWKEDVQLCSISGGTDIISCFALGNPLKPIIKGRLQSIGLGMNVKSFNENGKSLIGKKGELVCLDPFPSMPIYFYKDTDNDKYKNAYFDKYPNIWKHGDYVSIYEDGSVEIFGRSDTTLNPGGVRIGTAEIYRVMDKFDDVDDSVVIGYKFESDELIILFVKISEKTLNQELIKDIKYKIKHNCSPRHVPFKIIPVKDIPYTINGKKVEIAVKNIIEGKNVTNIDALSNPESLNYFKEIDIINYE